MKNPGTVPCLWLACQKSGASSWGCGMQYGCSRNVWRMFRIISYLKGIYKKYIQKNLKVLKIGRYKQEHCQNILNFRETGKLMLAHLM